MLPVKWAPFRELDSLHRDLDSMFQRLVGKSEGWMPAFRLGGEGYGLPHTEIVRKGDKLSMHIELPGIDPKDVEIEVHGNLLTIKGERKMDKETKEEDYVVREIGYGTFERSFTLPEGVDTDKIKAGYHNGILELTMPAGKAVKGRKIEIETVEEHKKLKAA
ncbi:MAG: Hsp20/alpha crystallin family protein [Nitrospirae bacterium]|nr:Hsp20/alpha crystallin family protein [Nitrospirota bacterium]